MAALVNESIASPLPGITDGVRDMVCGGGHALVFTDGGAVFAFGNNSAGQLGLGDRTHRATAVGRRACRKPPLRAGVEGWGGVLPQRINAPCAADDA